MHAEISRHPLRTNLGRSGVGIQCPGLSRRVDSVKLTMESLVGNGAASGLADRPSWPEVFATRERKAMARAAKPASRIDWKNAPARRSRRTGLLRTGGAGSYMSPCFPILRHRKHRDVKLLRGQSGGRPGPEDVARGPACCAGPLISRTGSLKSISQPVSRVL